MANRKYNQSAFSLIELMMVISIITLLTALSIPIIGRQKIKVARTEMRINLGNIYTLAQSFRAQNDAFATTSYFFAVGYSIYGSSRTNYCDPNFLGFSVTNCDKLRYMYEYRPFSLASVISSSAPASELLTNFTATATSYASFSGSTLTEGMGSIPINPRTCTRPSGASSYYADKWYMTENRVLDVFPSTVDHCCDALASCY